MISTPSDKIEFERWKINVDGVDGEREREYSLFLLANN